MSQWINLKSRLYNKEGELLNEMECPVCRTVLGQNEEDYELNLYEVCSSVLLARLPDPKPDEQEKAEKLLLDLHYAYKANRPIKLNSDQRSILKKRFRKVTSLLISTQCVQMVEGEQNPFFNDVVEEKAANYADKIDVEIEKEQALEAKKKEREAKKDKQKEEENASKNPVDDSAKQEDTSDKSAT